MLGAAIKATGGILLPFLFVGAKHRKQVVIGAAAAGAFVVAVVLVFFGDHPFAALLSFATQGDNISFKSFPGQVSQQLLGMDDVNFTVQKVANALLAIVVVGLLYRAWKGRSRLAGIRRVGDPGGAALAAVADALVHRLAAAPGGDRRGSPAAHRRAGVRRVRDPDVHPVDGSA